MRIASLSPAVTEILFNLGKAGQIVCRDQFSTFPESAKNIPVLNGHQNISIEDIHSYKPDLIFTSTLIQAKLAEELRTAGLEVVHQDPRTLDEVYSSIREIGVILDCERDALALDLQMRKGMNEVKKRARMLSRKSRLYIEEWHDPPMVSGNWVPDVIRSAGGESFPFGRGEPSREVSLEEVQKFDPEMIVLSICGGGSLVDSSLVTRRPGWEDLNAVKNGNIRVIDDSLLNRPGPRLVEGARRLYGWMFESLH
jgi:iron complex transport system substrate-binding protein